MHCVMWLSKQCFLIFFYYSFSQRYKHCDECFLNNTKMGINSKEFLELSNQAQQLRFQFMDIKFTRKTITIKLQIKKIVILDVTVT